MFADTDIVVNPPVPAPSRIVFVGVGTAMATDVAEPVIAVPVKYGVELVYPRTSYTSRAERPEPPEPEMVCDPDKVVSRYQTDADRKP
jgi:hypothetical protein